MPDFPTRVKINSCHNHRIYAASALIHRVPCSDTKEKFLQLFKTGHTPSQAVELFKRELKEEYEEEYFKIASDRAICPDPKWVYHLYDKMFQSIYGSTSGEEMVLSLENAVKVFNGTSGKAVFLKINNDIVVVVCTELMLRVHSLSSSKDIVFFDSSGNMDRYNCRVFLLVSSSIVGGLPLGVFITTSENETVITAALNAYKKMLPEKAFGGRGVLGPTVFMTDDCKAAQNSIRCCFPRSATVLCIFHVLQAAWRWLLDSKHGIKVHDHQLCYQLLSKILYSTNEEECFTNFEKAMENNVMTTAPNFKVYLEELFERRSQWALCYTLQLNTCGHRTNNIVEAAFRVLKDKVFARTRAYSLPQLFEFLTETLSGYYERKILNTIKSGRAKENNLPHFFSNHEQIKDLEVLKVDERMHLYNVHNPHSEKTYFVDIRVGVCECPVGETGAPCKHQHAVQVKYNVEGINSLHLSSESKLELHWVATGTTEVPEGWYGSLNYLSPKKVCRRLEDNLPTTSENIVNRSVSLTHNMDSSTNSCSSAGLTDVESMRSTAKQKLQEIENIIMSHFDDSPAEFVNAVTTAHKTVLSMRTGSAFLSALHTFGKYTGIVSRRQKNRTYIGVQPTSISRRKYKLGGRKCQHTGKPPKLSHVVEHGYTQKKM